MPRPAAVVPRCRCGSATTALSLSRARNSSRGSVRSGGRTKAKSRAPERILGSSRMVFSSISCTAMSGWASRKSCSSCGNNPAAALSMAPTRSLGALVLRARRRKEVSTASTFARMLRASRNSIVPCSVSDTARVVRANSGVARSSSSSLIWRPSAEGSICSRCAALPKCSSSAAAMKQRSWCNSISSDPGQRRLYHFFV